MYLIEIVAGILGISIGLNLFKIRDKVVEYKCEQLGRELPEEDSIPRNYKIMFVLVHTLLYIAAFRLMPIDKAIFVGLFITLATIFTLVDISIRIIPNEMVLILLLLGIIFNTVTKGFGSLKDSLLGLLLIIFLFGLTSLVVYFLRGTIGVGAGDLKLAMVAGIILGYPDVIYFLLGMAAAMLGYLALKYVSRTLIMGSSFPMAVQIMIGFIVGLFYPYIEHLIL